MKKLFFIAAIAGVALASCTKNEVAQSVNDQKAISFSSPVVGATTKASADLTYGLITGDYPTGQNFSVWAWYDDNTDTNIKGVKYMSDIEVAWANYDHNDETENGAWDPVTPYYWPKNGNLDFDAYSPRDIQGLNGCEVTCTAANGLVISNYTVPTVLENKHVDPPTPGEQIDVLFSTRSENKTSSIGSANKYEGVDIVFNHALSAIRFNVAQAGNYAPGTITLESIKVNAYNKGTFNQNITSTAAWTPVENSTADYPVLALTGYDNSIALATKEEETITKTPYESITALMLPQEFNDDFAASITITYFIKNGDETPLKQTHTFDLGDAKNQNGVDENEDVVPVASWDMGKIYTYNITIGLQDIYFAPIVQDWDEYATVTLPSINN